MVTIESSGGHAGDTEDVLRASTSELRRGLVLLRADDDLGRLRVRMPGLPIDDRDFGPGNLVKTRGFYASIAIM
ncbi:MAG TPA: hypothetical protein VF163_03915 [Micromonosporaceae bacterium]